MQLELSSGLIAVGLYLLAGILLLRSRSSLSDPKTKRILWLGFPAVVLHGLALFRFIFTPEGMNMSFFYAMSLVGWLAAFLLIIGGLTKPVEKLGIAVFPLAALALSLQFFFPGQRILDQSGADVWQLQSHILFSLSASSILYLAAIQAILLYIQDSHLRQKHPGGFIRNLPPLKTMEDLLFQIIVVGFVLLSIALATGFVFIDGLFSARHAHKTILSIFAWILFAILLFGRYQFGWRGRTAIGWTIGGFVSLVLAYFGSKLVLELVLQR